MGLIHGGCVGDVWDHLGLLKEANQKKRDVSCSKLELFFSNIELFKVQEDIEQHIHLAVLGVTTLHGFLHCLHQGCR